MILVIVIVIATAVSADWDMLEHEAMSSVSTYPILGTNSELCNPILLRAFYGQFDSSYKI